MSELQVTFNGRRYTFQPGTTVWIGRSSDNDVVVSDPTVSRRHAQLTWEAVGWVWQNAGQAATFYGGQPAARFGIGPLAEVALASPQGPVLRLESAALRGQAPVTFLNGRKYFLVRATQGRLDELLELVGGAGDRRVNDQYPVSPLEPRTGDLRDIAPVRQ